MRRFTLLICLITAVSYGQTFGIVEYANGFTGSYVTEIANAGDSRLFVTQLSGTIKIVKPVGNVGVVNAVNFLNLATNLYTDGNECGLLGLAFHPNYALNRYFYVCYTRPVDYALVITRYQASAVNPDIALPSSATEILVINQGNTNHNGGTLRFGPDGYLYISVGDGIVYINPQSYAQDVYSNRGKILRIDVNNSATYSIPPGNPFFGLDGNDEIWALGLRNPWKFSFNQLNGDLWIGDVGDMDTEEIDKITTSMPNNGFNFGWRCYEGNTPNTALNCTPVNYVPPIFTYNHDDVNGCSVTGGYYYSGSLYPNFMGKYIFGDLCAGKIMTLDDDGVFTISPQIGFFYMTTFGEDANGELYVSGSSKIYRLVDTSLGLESFSDSGISMYPNPAENQITIRNSSGRLLVTFYLYDLSGKLLTKQNLSGESTTIKTESIQTGLYVVKIEGMHGAIFTSKLTID